MLRVRVERRCRRPSRAMAQAIDTPARKGPAIYHKWRDTKSVRTLENVRCLQPQPGRNVFPSRSCCAAPRPTLDGLPRHKARTRTDQNDPPPTPTDHQGLSRSALQPSAPPSDSVLRPGLLFCIRESPISYTHQSLPLAYEWSILMDRPPVSLTSAAIHSHTRAYLCSLPS